VYTYQTSHCTLKINYILYHLYFVKAGRKPKKERKKTTYYFDVCKLDITEKVLIILCTNCYLCAPKTLDKTSHQNAFFLSFGLRELSRRARILVSLKRQKTRTRTGYISTCKELQKIKSK
jgi:hypothetical protein